MVALRMNQQPVKALPIDNRHRLLRGHGSVRGTVTPTDYGMAPWRALRVLIVDDEQDLAGGLFALVAARGHAAQMAHPGRSALIVAASEHPDVVLLNLEPSSLDGCHLARQLRLDAPRTNGLIIAVADWADDERRRLCSEAGIDLLLVNPVDPDVLKVLLGLECVRMNRQQAAEADKRHNFLSRIRVNHVDRNA